MNLFLDEQGILRTAGRINKSSFDNEVTNPILLMRDHHLTKLVIEDCHKKCKHLGLQTTVNKIRMSGFWITKIRQAVKTVISSCVICKKINSHAFKYPCITNLPKHRVNFIEPFKYTGIDYTGHVWVRDEKGAQKMYLLIFTCLNIRAIHIELVKDMSTHSFILALVRFTNNFGIPTHIYSDNAKSFVAGCNLIREVFSCSEYKEKFDVYDIQHIRIPLYSAWVGSTWERLIRVVKSSIYKTIGRSRISYFDLLTVISDIQHAINERPLTYRCSDDLSPEAITPNAFLFPNAKNSVMLKSNSHDLGEVTAPSQTQVEQSIQLRENILSKFKSLWYEEYLLGLRELCIDLHETKFENRIKKNEIVLIKNPLKSRPFWDLGRVVQLIHGSDDKVRSVKIIKGNGVEQLHSIKHLYPLELSLTHPHSITSSEQK